MPITIQNSAGGGVTLDSTTSSNETLQLPSGGGTLAPLASPVFTGNVGIGATSPSTSLHLKDNATGANTKLTVERSALSYTGEYAASHCGTVTNNEFDIHTNNTMRMRIDSSGNVLAGKTAANGSSRGCELRNLGQGLFTNDSNWCVQVRRLTNTGTAVLFYQGATEVGNISVTGSSTSYNTSSDYRLKENVTLMSGATAQTKLLKPCNFDWIAGGNVNGFIAHELADVVPEAVTGTKDAMKDEEYEVTPAVLNDEGNETTSAVMGTRSVPDMQGIDQSKLVPLLTATIQELITRIEALENV